jgi:hypothetical protein
VRHLTAGLPVVGQDLAIWGNRATLKRSHACGTPAFVILQADGAALTVSKLNFRDGSGAIAITDTATLAVNGGTFTGNTGGNGGAIFDFDGPDDQVTGSVIRRNQAASGGALSRDPQQARQLRARRLDHGLRWLTSLRARRDPSASSHQACRYIAVWVTI